MSSIILKLRAAKQYDILSEYVQAKPTQFKIYEGLDGLKRGEIVTLLDSTKNHVLIKDKKGAKHKLDADDFFDVAFEK